jgi:hypothetical protein
MELRVLISMNRNVIDAVFLRRFVMRPLAPQAGRDDNEHHLFKAKL